MHRRPPALCLHDDVTTRRGGLPPVIVVIERRAGFSDTRVAGSACSSFLFVAVAQFESDQHGSAPVSRVMPFAC
jgi:hypothetical protein